MGCGNPAVATYFIVKSFFMNALQGHGEEGMSGRYGRGIFLKKRAEAMGRLRYEGLDLGHLLPDVSGQKSQRASDQAAE
ncbi:protein of unknown function [Magnetospirillum sp. XM-1]|nr:protein of unknown function [Magnetospirillum sp. XM-1]